MGPQKLATAVAVTGKLKEKLNIKLLIFRSRGFCTLDDHIIEHNVSLDY